MCFNLQVNSPFDVFNTVIVSSYDTAEIHETVHFLQCSGSIH